MKQKNYNINDRKKAVIGNTIAMIIATILIIVLLIVFILIAKVLNPLGKANEKISYYEEERSAAYSLENYLQTPVLIDINGKQKEVFISDLILASEKDSSLKTRLNSESSKILSIFKNCYDLVYDSADREKYGRVVLDKTVTVQLNIDKKCLNA